VRVARSAAGTDTGRKRRRNEDSFICEPPLFAVADGMGGAQAGEVASSLAAAALREGEATASSGEEGVVEMIRGANRRVHHRAQTDASASGMGTTMTVAIVSSADTVTIGHVGDSRAYRLRNGELEQLTDDHSLVAELVRRGELSPAEAEVHPQRSVITRALGTDADVDVDAFSVEAVAGDVFLLCSDGLTTMLDAETIARVLGRNLGDLDAAARALIAAANERGGEDNITTVLFDVADVDDIEQTLEIPALAVAGFDEEDTLHPEDGVRLPPELLAAFVAPGSETAVLSPRPMARMALSALLIALLAGLIVVLVARGLAR